VRYLWNAIINGGTIDGAVIGGTTPAAGTFTNLSGTISDYQYIPIDCGIDSVMAAPDAAIKVQGVVGDELAAAGLTLAEGAGTWNTLTIASPNLTSAIYGSGTPTITFTMTGLTVGKLYRLRFTPTVTSQVPTFTATSGVGLAVIPTVVSATVENIYFRATAATAVFTATNTAASTWSTASTTLYEYSRPAIGREFSNSAQQSLLFDWMPPTDWNAGTITYKVFGVISQTAPADTKTAVFSLAGFCVGTSDSLSQAVGTAVTSTFTADATYALYDEWISTESAAVTLAGAAAGKKARLTLDRLTSGDYAQKILVTGITIHFTRTLAA
jgi:hypothetical protein